LLHIRKQYWFCCWLLARLREKNSMTTKFWNWLATTLMKIFFNATFTDLGPLEL
jgi:hypothetical protein